MQTQTQEGEKRFLVRFISGFVATVCLLVAGFVYLQYGIISFYAVSDNHLGSLVTLAGLLGTVGYCIWSFMLGRFLFFSKPK